MIYFSKNIFVKKRDRIDKKILKRNIRLIAHSLVKFIYKNNNEIADHLLTGDLVRKYLLFCIKNFYLFYI